MTFLLRPLSLAFALVCASGAQAANIDDFLRAASRATSVEEALRFLPAEMRESYTLQHTAIAFQGASYANPRVLTYSANGDLVIAFNGDSSQAGYETLEALQFRRDTKTFEIFEIEFESTGPVAMKNPPQCLGCHGKNPGPIWHSYGTWKRFFGSDEAIPDSPTGEEAKYLRQFNALVSSGVHARYRELKPRALGQIETTPFLGPRSAHAQARDLHFSPNFRLGMFLQRNASLAISHQLSRHPLYRELLPLTFFAATCADPALGAKSFHPPERAEFLRRYPFLSPTQYDRAEQNLRAILALHPALSLPSVKYFKTLGIDPARLLLQPESGTRTDRLFDDGLASRNSRSMAFYPGELLKDLHRFYPGQVGGFVPTRDEEFRRWTTSPDVLDRLDEITTFVSGGECASLWPLIVKTMSEVRVSDFVAASVARR